MKFSINRCSPVIDQSAYVAPNATVIGNVSIGGGSSIWFQTVIRADINEIKIGENTNIQDGCLLHVTASQALTVGDRVTIGHGVILHGCFIDSNCLISMGAIVLDGARIAKGSIVAAGSVVAPACEVPEDSLVMGVPAKVVRKLNDQDRAKIEAGWQNYVAYAKTFRENLEASE